MSNHRHRISRLGIFLLVFISFSFGAAIEASAREVGPDWKAAVAGRTRPLGAAVFAEGGYNISLWGDVKGEGNFWYGYLRPSLSVAASSVVGEGEAELQLYPVSFFGLFLGRSYAVRSESRSRYADCWNVICGGRLRGDYGGLHFIAGVGSIFWRSRAESRDLRPSEDSRDFYEDKVALVLNRGYDRVITHSHTLGYRFPSGGDSGAGGSVVGIAFSRTDIVLRDGFSEQTSLIFAHPWNEVRWAYSVGVYRSSALDAGLSVGISVVWRGRPGLGFE